MSRPADLVGVEGVGSHDLDPDVLRSVLLRETSYRYELDYGVDIDVRFLRRRRTVIDYVMVLLAYEQGEWRTVRVYDNTHETHDMHRYNRDGVKQLAEPFHRGSTGEALRSAIEAVRNGYLEMIESWRR
jgi:hypothetical protein